MRKKISIVLVVVVVLLIGAQFVPTIAGRNPVVTAAIDAPADVEAVLERSCYDCHSNTTKWPWYSRVAPVGWLVTHHVEEGRAHLNFSTWGELPEARQARKLEHVWEMVAEGDMPLRSYLWIHRDARLTPKDIETLEVWLKGLGVEPPAPHGGD